MIMECRKSEYRLKVDKEHPFMGLNNTVCRDPAYWCSLHEVWLSEEDVEKQECKCKMSYDMMNVRKCSCLEKRG